MDFFSMILKDFLAFLLFASSAYAFPARIMNVIDGDTVDVQPETGGERVRVRLHGIDAPERKQPYGEAAREFVFNIALFENVDVEPVGKPDRYGRLVAIILLPDGESLQALLLAAGLAWVWPRYCRDCREWQNVHDAARAAGRGLWAEPDPVPPWMWRRTMKGRE